MRAGEGARQCFVAVRMQPVERLLAVAFWKCVPECDGTRTAEIQWSALPALGTEISAFWAALIAHIAAQEPSVTTMAAADWLPAAHPTATVLEAVGFSATAGRTMYQADAAAWRAALCETPPLGADPVIAAPAAEHLPLLRTLLCGPSLRPSELAHGFQTAASHTPSLFDPRCSAVLLEGGKPVAACLANATHSHLTLAAVFGTLDACRALLHHCLQARDGLPEPSTLSFHLDDRDSASPFATLLASLPHQTAARFSRFTLTLPPPPLPSPKDV